MSNTIKCDECGGDTEIGFWPLCNGDPAKHVKVDLNFHVGFEPYV